MTRSMLDEAFGHHVWATQRLIDACMAVPAEQRETAVAGTYGSITALTTLGVEPPSIDVWEFGLQSGRSLDLPPA